MYFIISQLFSITLIISLISGCVPDVASVNDPNHKMSHDPKEGYAAFSILCEANVQQGIMYISPYHFDLGRELYYNTVTQDILFNCNINKPQYYLLRLPVGAYGITGFSIDTLVTGYNFKKLNFDVVSNKIVYIGRIYFQTHLNMNNRAEGKYSIGDTRKEDLRALIKKYKYIPSSQYIVKIASYYNNISK